MRIKITSTKKERFIKLMIVAFSCIFITIAVYFLYNMDNDKNINEGYFKINDIAISNLVDITNFMADISDNVDIYAINNDTDNENIKFDLSINSKIDIMIAKLSENIDVTKMFINNLKVSAGDYYIYDKSISLNSDNIISLSNENKLSSDTVLELEYEEKNNAYLTSFSLLNANVKEALELKKDISEDFSILKAFDVNIYENESYVVSFNINIVDSKTDIYTSKINMIVRLEDLAKNGYNVNKLNIGNITFKKVKSLF